MIKNPFNFNPYEIDCRSRVYKQNVHDAALQLMLFSGIARCWALQEVWCLMRSKVEQTLDGFTWKQINEIFVSLTKSSLKIRIGARYYKLAQKKWSKTSVSLHKNTQNNHKRLSTGTGWFQKDQNSVMCIKTNYMTCWRFEIKQPIELAITLCLC